MEKITNTSKCLCDEEFDQNGLQIHCLTFHEKKTNSVDGKQNQYKCDSCDKLFSRKEYVKIHVDAVHKGLKKHKCEPCNKSFSQAAHLKKHIHTVHEGHKDFKCESFGKSFTHTQSLKKHIFAVNHFLKQEL